MMHLSTLVVFVLIASVNCLQCDETARRLIDAKLVDAGSPGSRILNAVASNSKFVYVRMSLFSSSAISPRGTA